MLSVTGYTCNPSAVAVREEAEVGGAQKLRSDPAWVRSNAQETLLQTKRKMKTST